MEMLTKEKAVRTVGVCDSSEGVNKISDDIFHHIFSFIDIFDAVGLSLVSKRWKDVCCTRPYLDFDIPYFCHKGNLVVNGSLIENLKDFINWVIISRSSTKIVRFKLKCENIFTQQQIFRWICTAASRNVQEVMLHFDPSETFELPFSLVTCSSLRVLKLFLFGRPLQLPRYPGFCQLKCLELHHLQLSDGDLARNLFSGCPLLENLILRDCELIDMKVLDITSSSIKYVSVEDHLINTRGFSECSVKISCPKLLSFRYIAPIPRCYLLDNLSLLENIWFDPSFDHATMSHLELGYFLCGMLKAVPNLIALKLGLGTIWALNDVHKEVTWSLCLFHELKCLNLWLRIDEVCMHVMIMLLKNSPKVEALNLYCDEIYEECGVFKYDDCSRITFLTSHLKYVRLISFKGHEYEMEFVRFLLENGLVLEKLIIICEDTETIAEITEEVMRFTRSSSSIVVTILTTNCHSTWFSL